MRFASGDMRGPHHFTQERPRVSVSALQSIAAVKTPKNQLWRTFRSRSIFDFCKLSANSGLMHRNKNPHSITPSAVTCSVSGTVRPSAFAVLRLITSSNLVGCITGKSAGFAPWRIRPV